MDEIHPLESVGQAIRWRLDPSDEQDPAKVGSALRERVKELNCLYGIMQLAEAHPNSLEALLAGVVSILPPSWQYPPITCARITFRGTRVTSPGFRTSKWRQSARIILHGEPAGTVDVFYLEERPPSFEGPFLREERALLDAVAERIGTVAGRIETEQELQEINRQLLVERQALHETNAALRAILARIAEEKREISRDLHANVEKVLMPILHALALRAPRELRQYIDLLRDNLEDITSPFVNRLSLRYQSLTPTEVRICNMIRSGMRTKEIAQIRGVSPATISRHREHIRRKLDLVRNNTNLATFLQANMMEPG